VGRKLLPVKLVAYLSVEFHSQKIVENPNKIREEPAFKKQLYLKIIVQIFVDFIRKVKDICLKCQLNQKFNLY